MIKRMLPLIAVTAAAAGLPSAAEAHTFGAAGAGFAHGFIHPWVGLDHLLAMVAVGLWAAQIGGRAVWLVPASFLGVMVVGGAVGLGRPDLPVIELGIAGSLLVLGALIAFAWRPPLLAGMAVVGLFAVFHGYAHGAEMPLASEPLLYGLGFVLATAILHGIGIALGLMMKQGPGARAVRAGGAAVAAVGMILIAGA